MAAYAKCCSPAHTWWSAGSPPTHADPLILPIVAVLNGLGLVMIHRLDLGSGHTGETVNATESTHNADQQLLWAVLGLIAFTVILFFVRDHRTLSRYAHIMGVQPRTVTSGHGDACRSCPHQHPRSNGSKELDRHAGVQHPTERVQDP